MTACQPAKKEESIQSGSTTAASPAIYLNFNNSNATVYETNTNLLVNLQRTGNSSEAITAKVRVQGNTNLLAALGTITANTVPVNVLSTSPYIFEVPIPANISVVQLKISLIDNSAYELSKIINFQIMDVGIYDIMSPSSFGVTILNEDPFPVVSFGGTTPSIAEGGTTPITLSLSNASGTSVYVPLTISGTSISSDHNLVNQIITFAPGVTTQNITVNASADAFNEVSESIIVSMGPPSGASIGAFPSETVTITDVSPVPQVNFLSAVYSVDEIVSGTTTVVISAQLTGTLQQQISVPLTTPTGTALTGADFSISGNNFIFPAGVLNPIATITITTIDDIFYESNETIILNLTATAYSTLGGTPSTTVTVVENEPAPQIGFIEAAQSTQEASTYYLTVILNTPSSQDHVVTYTINASTATQTTDYVFGTLPTGTITVPAGLSMVQIPITITQDNQLDDNETISITLSAPTNGAALTPAKDNIIVTIREASSLPKISFQISNQIGDEGTVATVNVLLSSPSEYAINFTMMTNSSSSSATDFTSLLTYTIPASATSYSFPVTLVADGLDENEEEVTFLLLQPSNLSIGSISSHRIRIRDMDAPSTATLASTIVGNSLTEGDPIDPNAFTITLNAASSFNISIPYTISGTATALTDHDLITGIAIIPAGSLSVNIALEAYDDNFYESAVAETAIITLGSGPHYTLFSSTETISINEADAIPTANFLSATLTHNENDIVSLPIVLSEPTAADTVVNYILDHTAACALALVPCATANDHTLIAGSVTIPEGQTLGVVSFQIKNDSLYEGVANESFRVTLASTNDPLMALIGATDDVDINIVNIDPIPQIYFSEIAKSKLEGTPFYTVPIYLSHGSTFPVVVNLELKEGSTTYLPNTSDMSCPSSVCTAAASPSIYTTTVTFPAETLTAGLDIAIFNDALYEGPEEFTINMTGVVGGVINPAADIYTMMILDDETYPVISVNFAVPAMNEGTTLASYTNVAVNVSLSVMCEHVTVTSWLLFTGSAKYSDLIDSGSPSTFQIGDYKADGLALIYPNNRLMIINPMVMSQSLTAKIAQDSKYEYDETIIATLSGQNNATLSPTASSSSFTITNDDVTKPNLYINSATAIAVTMKEYDSYATGINLYLADPTKTYTGEEVTERPVTVTYTMSATLRAGGAPILQTGTILLNSANSFTTNISFNSSLFAVDKRSILDFDFFLYFPIPDEALIDTNLLSAPYYVFDGTYGASYTGNIALEYNDLEIGISRGSTTSLVGVENHLEGHSCTLYRGLVSCFGRGTDGQLGKGNSNFYGRDLGEDVTLQANTTSLGTDSGGYPNYATQIALGTSHSCALFNNNKMKCWGNNTFGQLGLGSTQTTFGTSPAHMGNNLPFLDLGTTDTITSIHAMHFSTCAVFSTGKAKCWGKNDFGQLGLDHATNIGTTSAQMGTALEYVKGVTGIELFATGGNHACATTSSTTLRCWGYNTSGQLGLNKVIDPASVPTHSVGGIIGDMALTSVNIDDIGDIVTLTAGRDHTCVTFNPATKTTFNSRCWGDNFFGQLGISRTTRGGEYTTTLTACDWYTSNCTDAIGKTWSATTKQSENMAFNGHSVLTSGIPDKPADSTSAGYLVDLNVPNNQFVQLSYPIYEMAAGETYTCGVVKTSFDAAQVGPAITVRCWGSNIIIHGNRASTTPTQADQGILNNNGYSVWADQRAFTDIPAGLTAGACTAGVNVNNTACDYTNSLKIIGDQGGSGTGNKYTNAWYFNAIWGTSAWISELSESTEYSYVSSTDNDYRAGFSNNFGVPLGIVTGQTQGLDHEMRAHSHSKFNWGAVTDIKIRGGDHHVCALPKFSALGVNDGTNKQLRCWGNNYAGQLGIPWTYSAYQEAKIVGGLWAWGAGSGQTLTFNYSF